MLLPQKYITTLLFLVFTHSFQTNLLAEITIELPESERSKSEAGSIKDPFEQSRHEGFDIPVGQQEVEPIEQTSGSIDISTRSEKDRTAKEDSDNPSITTIPSFTKSATSSLLIPGKIEVNRGVIKALVDTIKGLFKQMNISPLKTALEPLNAALDKIAQLSEGTELSPENLQDVQNKLADVTEILNNTPESNYSKLLKLQLNNLTAELYGKGVTIDDILPAADHLTRAKEALEWIKDPVSHAEEILKNTQLLTESKHTETELVDARTYSQDILGALTGALDKLEPGASENLASHLIFTQNPRLVIADVEYAINLLDRYLQNSQKADPLTRVILQQDAYATLVTARSLFSALASAPVDNQLHEDLLKVLNNAKDNYKETEDLAKQLSIVITQH